VLAFGVVVIDEQREAGALEHLEVAHRVPGCEQRRATTAIPDVRWNLGCRAASRNAAACSSTVAPSKRAATPS
jgi:hypothetical protein